jgi:hypothetical protein
VGILLKNTSAFTVLSETREPEENAIFLRLRQTGSNQEFYIGAVYGPNRYEPAFFLWLRDFLDTTGNTPLIFGGDWNCTYSNTPARINADVLNMANIPNKRHSDLLLKLCEDFSLCDPYRSLNPERNEFTFIPSDPTKNNRSRIDFFIISESIIGSIASCTVNPGLQNKLFDHKAIQLDLRKKPPVLTPPTVSKGILADPDTDLVVGLATADTYILYSTTALPEEKLDMRERISTAWRSLRAAGPDNKHLLPGERTEEEDLNREGLLADVREFLDDFPFSRLRDGTFDIKDNIFLECLINNIRNETVSFQQFVKKKSRSFMSDLLKKIDVLKNTVPLNQDSLHEFESILNKKLDTEMRAEIENLNSFE